MTSTLKYKTFLADLFMYYDGETDKERSKNWDLGILAENNPEKLTPKQAWKTALFIDGLQRSPFRSREEVLQLEEIRHDILTKLTN